ncbi:beta-ketoacyl-[acyl-carrier-protein] synthase family protein [Amycolatopsis speibonae]|uniref:Beta-ketoacyl-[acyl-carrier-protein] synthase family protein n=1 Tax=Amycolatopsis speibonae TaxID=1450224 RepID=A0ABV7NX26_9PSEU
MNEVVITGLGAMTPLGTNTEETWDCLLAGKSGARSLQQRWAEGLPSRIAAQIFQDPAGSLGRVEARRLDRAGQFATLAAREAWADAGRPDVDPDRLGVVLASAMGGAATLLDAYDTFLAEGPRKISPHMLASSPAAALGVEYRARAGVHSPASTCVSGSDALAQGLEMIRGGRADVVIAGGVDVPIHPLLMGALGTMTALSTRNDEPERASRPFDRDRDGFVLGEGAGVVIMESAAYATARKTAVYAELSGVGMSSDGRSLVAPAATGLATAIGRALSDSGTSPGDVVHVNAHATSTPQGDLAEATALRMAFGSATDRLAVSATKSMTGHLLGAAGAVEAVATVLALHHRIAPPTINVDTLDAGIGLDVVLDEPRTLPTGPIAALSNSAGFGGNNVALVFHAR